MSSLIPSAGAPASSENHDVYLDWLRGLAALSVFLTHVRSGFFVKWSDLDPSSHGPVNYLLFLLTRLGRESVIIFFVLSGYLVGGHALSAFRRGRYSLTAYLAARIARLYAVVIPALLLTGVLDFLNGEWDRTRDGVQLLLVNLLFLQGIFGGTYGSNAPFWSLSYEWWFYILFGFSLVVIARSSTRTAALGTAVLAGSVCMLALKCPQILLMLPLWLGGVLVSSVPAPRYPKLITIPLSFAGLCAALMMSNTRWDWQGDFTVAVAVALFLYFLRTLDRPKSARFSVGHKLAAFSFSLYALHYPLNKLVLSMFIRERVRHAGAWEWLQWTAIVLAEASVCWVFYWLFERRTPALRKALLRVISLARATNPGARQQPSSAT
jgi:peptidoglycan/LPS O-acetylase OafA/YrhL